MSTHLIPFYDSCKSFFCSLSSPNNCYRAGYPSLIANSLCAFFLYFNEMLRVISQYYSNKCGNILHLTIYLSSNVEHHRCSFLAIVLSIYTSMTVWWLSFNGKITCNLRGHRRREWKRSGERKSQISSRLPRAICELACCDEAITWMSQILGLSFYVILIPTVSAFFSTNIISNHNLMYFREFRSNAQILISFDIDSKSCLIDNNRCHLRYELLSFFSNVWQKFL